MSKSKSQLRRKLTRQNLPQRASQQLSRNLKKNHKTQRSQTSNQLILRLFLVWGILVLATCGLSSRLYYLQIVNPIVKYEQAPNGKRLTQIATDQQTTRLNFYIPRRQIVDRQQNVLATDRITYTLYVHPHLFKRNSQPVPAVEIADKLSEILGSKTSEDLLKIFTKQEWGIRLAGDLPESAKEKIAALQIDG